MPYGSPTRAFAVAGGWGRGAWGALKGDRTDYGTPAAGAASARCAALWHVCECVRAVVAMCGALRDHVL